MECINRYHVMVLIMLWLLVHLFLFEHYGIRHLFDSAAYVNRADFLIKHHTFEGKRDIFYAVPIGMIALFRILFHESILPYLLFQSIISGLAMFALYLSGAKLFNSPLAGLFSGLFFVLWWDNIHWDIAVMTESLFCSFTCFMVFILAHFKNTIKGYVWISIVMIIIFFTRPTGVIIVAGVIAYLFRYHWIWINQRLAVKFVVITGILIMSYISADIMFRQWDFRDQYENGNIITYANTIDKSSPYYRENLIIKPDDIQRPHSNEVGIEKIFFFIIHNPSYFVMTASLKIWYLVSTTRPYYSLFHNIYATTWIVLIYLTYYFGLRKTKLAPVRVFTLTVLIINCCLIAISTVDWDNRFFIPMEPGLVVLAGGGAAIIINFFKIKKSEI